MRSRGLAPRRQPRQRRRRRRVQGPEQRRPALRRRVRQAQDPRRHRRHDDGRPSAAGRLPRLQVGPRAQQPAACGRCCPTRRAYEIVTFEDETRAPAGLAELAPAGEHDGLPLDRRRPRGPLRRSAPSPASSSTSPSTHRSGCERARALPRTGSGSSPCSGSTSRSGAGWSGRSSAGTGEPRLRPTGRGSR